MGGGDQPTSLITDYAALATQPQLAADLRLGQDAQQETVVAAVRNWLERHRRWLLVIDNVDKLQAVAELLPRSATGHVLITSRAGIGWDRLAVVVPVEVLDSADAAGFLVARTGYARSEAKAAATTLAKSLGGLPLALEQAGAYIVATGAVSLAGYADLFATRGSELLKRGQPLDYQHTVATTRSLALQTLQQEAPAAVGLLTLAAFLAPDDLPQPLLLAHHELLPEPLASHAGDPLALADLVATLRHFSLVKVVADGLFVHRLLQTVVRAALDTDAERRWATAAIRLLRGGFPDKSNEVVNWPECERLLPHGLAVARHGERLEVEAEAWLWLWAQAARYLWSRGQYQQARTVLERTLARHRRVLGDDHPDTLSSMSNLAASRRGLGDLQGARRLHEQTLAARRRVLGDDHPDTLSSMNNLAATLADLGDFQRARQLQERTLEASRRVLGDDHPNTLGSMTNLAATRHALGDLQGARELHEQALAGLRQVLGDHHPDTLQSMNRLDTVRRELGEL